MLKSFRLVQSEIGFILTLAAGYQLACTSLGDVNTDPMNLVILWSVGSALLAYAALESMDYFASYRPLPKSGDILSLVLILPLPAMILKYLIYAVFQYPLIRYREIVLGAPVVALLGFLYQYAAGLLFLRMKKRRKVRLILSDSQKKELIQELESRGLLHCFEWVGEETRPELIVISRSTVRQFGDHEDVLKSHLDGVLVLDHKALLTELRGRVILESTDLWSFLLVATPQTPVLRIYFHVKSIIEPIIAFSALVILSPVSLAIALAIKLTSPGPVIYKQLRTGYRGKKFYLYKFRSMRVDAEASGPAWAGAQSTKITRLGKFLRKTHLDEIPQLWNILRGEMSLVGPRPERPEFYELLHAEIPLFDLRTLIRPGVTGWAQVTGGYASSTEASRLKLEYDIYYMQNMSPRMDFIVLIKTLLIFLQGKDQKAE